MSLSRPDRSAAPSRAPRATPALSPIGCTASAAAASSSRATFTPMSAAGTRPKLDSAEVAAAHLRVPVHHVRRPEIAGFALQAGARIGDRHHARLRRRAAELAVQPREQVPGTG